MNTLYFIAILPHSGLQKEVTELKKHMAVNFQSKAALTSPPHITLYPPFREKEENETGIIDSLSRFAAGQKQFELRLNGFGCFSPRTIFIKPEENNLLNSMQANLLLHLKATSGLRDTKNSKAYHAHMTIATRDLEKPMFFKAWNELRDKEFFRTFSVNSIALLKHNGKCWDILKEFVFPC